MIWRYEPFYDLDKALAFENTVNSDAFLFQGLRITAGQCLCTDMLPMEEYDSEATIFKIGYHFKVRSKGEYDGTYGSDPFQWRFLDAGRRGWRDKGGTKVSGELIGPEGQTSVDVRLNGKGKPVDAKWTVNGCTAVELDTSPVGVMLEHCPGTGAAQQSEAFFLKFDRYRRVAFSGLGL